MTQVPLPSPAALRVFQTVCDMNDRRETVTYATVALKNGECWEAWQELLTCGWIRQSYRPCVQVAVMPEAVGGSGIETRLGKR